MRVEEGFKLTPLEQGHPYITDPVLSNLLSRLLPRNVFKELDQELIRFGHEVETTIRTASVVAHPPRLTQYDHWGHRIDKLETSESWRTLKAISQREGIPGIFYERKYGEYSRVFGFAKVLLMSADSVVIMCPIGMTDGCARALELYGTPEMKKAVFPRLISRNPSVAFTSGQWMTERPGGSTVSDTETTATPCQGSNDDQSARLGPVYSLDGFKWFSSATDAEVAVALARTGPISLGIRSLSLFLVPLRLPLLRTSSSPEPSSGSNGVLIHRLKNKIGTHILPTAELSLDETRAYLLGSLNEGIKSITPVLTITRMYSAMMSISHLRKCLAIATAYSKVRAIKGGTQLLKDTPLHVAQLASIRITYSALVHLAFGVLRLLGKEECDVADDGERARLRMLTPTLKAFAAELAVGCMVDAMTTLGGQGYMEENEIGRAIRDGLVEKIWEGTTTVLSLDLVRATKEPSVMAAFLTWCEKIISSLPAALHVTLRPALDVITPAMRNLSTLYNRPMAPLVSRPALMLVGYVASSIYLLEHALRSGSDATNEEKEQEVEVIKRWVMESGFVRTIQEIERAKADGVERLDADRRIAKL